MKNTFIMTILAALLAVTLSSCDPDDDYSYFDAPFLGAWIQDNGSSSFTFYDNGVGTYTDFYNGGISTSFIWDADDYYLTVYIDVGYGPDTWDYQWSFIGGNLSRYDLDYGGTLYYYPY